MNRKRRLRMPSPSLVIAVVALFVALGGTSVAAISALPKNSVGTKQLKSNAVTGAKIANGTVTASKIDPSGLTVPTATHATSADTATSADSATSAGTATNAADAAKLGDQLPSFYLPASAVHRIGPIRVSACTSLSCSETTLITLGQLSFNVDCSSITTPGQEEDADIELESSADGASYAVTNSLKQALSQPDMTAGHDYAVAESTLGVVGQPVFVSVNGETLSADGDQISFDLYVGQNTGGASDGSCVFGGSFVVT
jgi:hypothetical protein